MLDQDTVRIPLRARDGSIRAYAIIDATDAEFVNQWRWHLGSNGYAERNVHADGKKHNVSLHRELLGLTRGDGLEGDHIDRDRLNDRRENLRILTRPLNRQNTPSTTGSSSRYRGVCWHKLKLKWTAYISLNYRRIHLGNFSDEHEAGAAALAARQSMMTHSVD